MLSDLSMLTLGGDLKRKERVSARLGDMLSHLYLATATLKRFNDEGRQQEDLPLVKWSVENSLYEIQQAMNSLIKNFPNKWVGYLLRAIALPFGCWLEKPSDKLDHQVARIMQTPCASRDRLGQGQYLTRNQHNMLGQLEQTLEDIIAVEPIFDKLCKAINEKLPFYNLDKAADRGLAVKAISQAEAELFYRAEKGRKNAINVDDFEPEVLAANKNLHSEVQQTPKQESAA